MIILSEGFLKGLDSRYDKGLQSLGYADSTLLYPFHHAHIHMRLVALHSILTYTILARYTAITFTIGDCQADIAI